MTSMNWRQNTLLLTLAVVSVVASLAGCSGGGGGEGTPTPCSTISPTLSTLQGQVFNTTCALNSCHGHTSPEKGLDMSTSMRLLATASNKTAVELFNGAPTILIVLSNHAAS